MQPDAGTLETALRAAQGGDVTAFNTLVVVYGTNSVRYQNMVNVFDALQRADVTRVGLATEFPAGALNQIQTEN